MSLINLNLTSVETAPLGLSLMPQISSFLQLAFTAAWSSPSILSNWPLKVGWGGMGIGLTTNLSVG